MESQSISAQSTTGSSLQRTTELHSHSCSQRVMRNLLFMVLLVHLILCTDRSITAQNDIRITKHPRFNTLEDLKKLRDPFQSRHDLGESWTGPVDSAKRPVTLSRHKSLTLVTNFSSTIASAEKRQKSSLNKSFKMHHDRKIPIDKLETKTRMKRDSATSINWIDTESDSRLSFRMVAHIVRDKENEFSCEIPARKQTKTRYYICSGAILNAWNVLTSASCINRAVIHTHMIEGDVGVLVGSPKIGKMFNIKMSYFTIHQSYNPDLDSSRANSVYNLAMITLSCSIKGKDPLIPQLPKAPFSDVGHVCCPDLCAALTVETNAKAHRHVLTNLTVKYVPQPEHEEIPITIPEEESQTKKFDDPIDLNANFSHNNVDRVERHAQQLGAEVILLGKDRRVGSNSLNDGDSTFANLERTRRDAENTDQEASIKDENLAKSSDNSSTTNNSEEGKPSLETKFSVAEPSGQQEFETEYVKCPPLGSPIINGGRLIALISYTCDDEQDKTRWRYVNIQKNIDWINSNTKVGEDKKNEEKEEGETT